MERDSFDDISSEEMLVMATDNINIEGDSSGDEEEPTKTLIVTNVDSGVFLDELTKSEFESKFLAFDKTAAFYYIRSVCCFGVDNIQYSPHLNISTLFRELIIKNGI